MSQEELNNVFDEWLELASKEDFEELFNKIFERFVYDKDYYKYAYKNSESYRIFIENLSAKNKKNINKVHAAQKIVSGTNKLRKGIFGFATMGLSVAASAALKVGKKKKKDIIKETVDSEYFNEFFEELNKGLNNKVNNE